MGAAVAHCGCSTLNGNAGKESILFTHLINLFEYADNYMLDKNGDVSKAK